MHNTLSKAAAWMYLTGDSPAGWAVDHPDEGELANFIVNKILWIPYLKHHAMWAKSFDIKYGDQYNAQ